MIGGDPGGIQPRLEGVYAGVRWLPKAIRESPLPEGPGVGREAGGGDEPLARRGASLTWRSSPEANLPLVRSSTALHFPIPSAGRLPGAFRFSDQRLAGWNWCLDSRLRENDELAGRQLAVQGNGIGYNRLKTRMSGIGGWRTLAGPAHRVEWRSVMENTFHVEIIYCIP